MAGHAQPRVVVDHVEHLEDDAVSHLDMGDIGLPALVGEVSLEADPGALGAFLGVGRDEAPRGKHPLDGRHRRDVAPGRRHVEVDRLGSGVDAEVLELFVPAHDLVLVEIGDARRGGFGASRPRLESGRALQAIATQQLEEPALAHPVGRSQLLDGAAGPQVRLDQEPALVHRRPLPLGLSYVLTDASARDSLIS